MKHSTEQHYSFYGEILCSFQTDNPEFFDFTEKMLGFFKTEREGFEANLVVEVFFHKKKDIKLEKKLAHNIFFDADKILYRGRGFTIYARGQKPFYITAYVQRDWARDIFDSFRFGVIASRRGKYLNLLRRSFYLPLFYLLELKGYSLLHGSAVAKDEKAYLFLGANYVGKTNTVLELVLRHGFSFAGDNFILVKDNTIYPFPDGIRAKDYKQDFFQPQKKRYKIAEKYYFPVPQDKVASPSHIQKTFFLQLGPEPLVEKMEFPEALRRLTACHSYLQEFPEYSYLGFLPNFPAPNIRQERLDSLLKSQELFLLQSSPDIKKTMELLLRHLN